MSSDFMNKKLRLDQMHPEHRAIMTDPEFVAECERLWDAIHIDGFSTLRDLLDGLQELGKDEGQWDCFSDGIELLPYIEQDEDLNFYDRRLIAKS